MKDNTILKGKKVKVFLNNNFKYEGPVIGEDETFLYVDDVKKGMKPIKLSDIKDIEVMPE